MSADAPIGPDALRAWFGDIDVYLFDQLLKGRLRPGMAVLDAGCGGGRNLVYLLRAGFRVSAADVDAAAVRRVRAMAASLAPELPDDAFRCEAVEALTFAEASFDAVILSAVLHFARDEAQWTAMVERAWHVLRPGGLFFARLASTAGIEDAVVSLGNRRFTLPDGSERFLVDEAMLARMDARLGATRVDPLRTTLVHGQRSMTTWVLRRAPA